MEGIAHYVIDAVLQEGRSHRDVAKATGISKAWVTKLVARYKLGGEAALVPRSRRPKSCGHATPPAMQQAVLDLREQLQTAGHDCGPQTIWHHLKRTHSQVPSLSTIWRILKRNDCVIPEPHKRPRCSFVRFEASLPNQMWQSDFTHWHLADGSVVEILNYIDDHSRFLLGCTAFHRVKGADVVQTFYEACNEHGFPASLLTDNGAVYTGRTRKGKIFFETELERLGIIFKHSTPYHPQTCGKVERFHQTLKRFLAKQLPAHTYSELQQQLDTFRQYYNHHRPHRALQGDTPLTAFNARIKARAANPAPTTYFRVRLDKVSKAGNVTVRYLGKLRHIGLARAHRGRSVRLLIADDYVRVLGEDGDLIRELKIDPTRDYQPLRQIGHYVPQQRAL